METSKSNLQPHARTNATAITNPAQSSEPKTPPHAYTHTHTTAQESSSPKTLQQRSKEADFCNVINERKIKLNINDSAYKYNNDGCTPLDWAAKEGRIESIKLLLRAGAEVNAQEEEDDNEYSNGQTSLHWAANFGQTGAIKLLLEAKVDFNAKNKIGETPLACAAKAGQTESIKLLLAAQADPNIKDNEGKTPLQKALDNGNFEAAALLQPTIN